MTSTLFSQLPRTKQIRLYHRADDLGIERGEYVRRMCRAASQHTRPLRWLSQQATAKRPTKAS